jgi:hypothetical protein
MPAPMTRLLWVVLLAVPLGGCAVGVPRSADAVHLAGFTTSAHWEEQVYDNTLEDGIRVHMNAPAAASMNRRLPTRLIVYALPNGNTIEQTAGRHVGEGDHWRYDIQHIAAQTRLLRRSVAGETIVVAYLEAPGLSWPAWRRETPDSGERIVAVLEELRALANPGGGELRILLTGHSGGGSFTFGYLNAVEAIDGDIDRIAFLDSNYGYTAEDGHGRKLIAWLRGDPRRTLVVIAYDDREITLEGRRVVGPTGGTWRASYRLFEDFQERGVTFRQSQKGPFLVHRAMEDQVIVLLHPNPNNAILHTVLVGDMNGLLHAATLRTPWEETWGTFGGPRAYEDWIQETE